MAEHLGVVLGGPFVEPGDRTVVARSLTQSREHAAAGRAGGETRQRHRASDPPPRHRVVSLWHWNLQSSTPAR